MADSKSTPTILDRFEALSAKVDTMFEAVSERHGAAMKCGSGCADCCHTRLTVTMIEAGRIATGVARLSSQERADLVSHASRPDDGRCAALGADDRCRIYRWRPLVCRSHGAPIRVTSNDGIALQSCFRNFDGGDAVVDVPAADIFDQTTLSTVLGALDSALADESGTSRGVRVDLAELLSSPGQFTARLPEGRYE